MARNVISEIVAGGAKIQRLGAPLQGTELEDYERAKAALNTDAKENFKSEEWHREQAATLASVIDYGFTNDPLFSSYIPQRVAGEYEHVFVRERRGLQVFYTARGGYIEESTLKTMNFEVPRDTLGFHVSEFEDNLEANYADTIESVVALGMQRMEAEVVRRQLTLAQEAVTIASPYYVDASGTGLTPTVLNDALVDVEDAIKPNGAGPVGITVLGRAAGINAISDFPGFADEAKEEIRLRGRLGVYRGANLQKVVNYTDENGDSYVPDNEVWVLGGQAGLFVRYGALKSKTWTENTADYRHYRVRGSIGGLVHHPEQIRRIKIG